MARNPTTEAGASGGISSHHPLYQTFVEDWEQMDDTYHGQRRVKEAGVRYLPPTQGMIEDGMKSAQQLGWKAYDAYRRRAVFPDFVAEAVEAMIGVMHHKPPQIELPSVMEPMREMATLNHESLEVLLRRINEQQLVTGRLGLMLDLPSKPIMGSALPYIAVYEAPKIINWDVGRSDGIGLRDLNMVVLDESEYERQADFSWEWQKKLRVLTLGDPTETFRDDLQQVLTYMQGVFRDDITTFTVENMMEPVIRGKRLEQIPFVFINSKDIVSEPDDPPLLGISNLALTVYRGEADYRQTLFMQGQDTLVVIGGSEDTYRVGVGQMIKIGDTAGDAKYIGPSGEGLPEMRTSLENDYARASQKGGQLLDSVSRQKESGEALSVRVAARTATLNQLAMAGAFGLQKLLRQAAEWIGANPEEVVVEPNLDFIDDTLGGEELVKLATAKSLGAPLSRKSIHDLMANKGLTEMTYEDEIKEIMEEEPLVEPSTDPDGPDPNDPSQDPQNQPEPDNQG